MNIPLISIITPTYNRKELLVKAILSVINQKKNIPFDREMIITDDWSTDWTKEYIQQYLDRYSNITYFYQENAGVGKARNTCLSHMSKDSDYTILLDSDDEFKPDLIYTCLKKRDELKKKWQYEKILWFYFLCEDENWRVIGDKKILQWKTEISFDYMSYLKWETNIEMWILLKSHIFLNQPFLKFPEQVVNEWIIWAQMYQYIDKYWFKMLLWDYVGRFYRMNHTSETRICKTISKDRFEKNALWNEIILKIIWKDLIAKWLLKIYWDYYFRIGVNFVLASKRKKWLYNLRQSLIYTKSIKILFVYLVGLISSKLLLQLYKRYI